MTHGSEQESELNSIRNRGETSSHDSSSEATLYYF